MIFITLLPLYVLMLHFLCFFKSFAGINYFDENIILIVIHLIYMHYSGHVDTDPADVGSLGCGGFAKGCCNCQVRLTTSEKNGDRGFQRFSGRSDYWNNYSFKFTS